MCAEAQNCNLPSYPLPPTHSLRRNLRPVFHLSSGSVSRLLPGPMHRPWPSARRPHAHAALPQRQPRQWWLHDKVRQEEPQQRLRLERRAPCLLHKGGLRSGARRAPGLQEVPRGELRERLLCGDMRRVSQRNVRLVGPAKLLIRVRSDYGSVVCWPA